MEENDEVVEEVVNTDSQEEITTPQNNTEEENSEVNEMEFSDDANGEEGNPEEESKDDEVESTEPQNEEAKSKKQTKAENSKFAAKRREQEAIVKRKEDEAFKKGLAAALVGTINNFTGEKIEDQDDIDEYLLMKEAEKAGFDPATELSKYQKHKAREERKSKANSFDVEADISSFREKYPDININDLIKDKDFTDFAEPFAQKVPLSTIYAQYNLMKSRIDLEAKTKAEEKYKRKISSPGSLVNNSQEKSLSFADMNDDEFEKEIQKAKRGDYVKS